MRLLDDRVATTAPAAIAVHDLHKTYAGAIHAVRGIDFEVAPGEVFGLLGPNGAGKSTTVGMLTTTIAPTSGSASLAGLDVIAHPLAARRASSVVFQEPVVDRSLTGRANLMLHARLWGVAPERAAHQLTTLSATLGLSELLDRPVATFSGGERRRLEIARALVSEPQVLFLDEPTVGLDPRVRHELLDVIATLRGREAMTILLTTHYLDEAQRLCDRVAIMHAGRIVALDTPSGLLGGLGAEILEVRIERDPAGALERLRAHGVASRAAFRVGATLTLPLPERGAAEAIAAIGAIGLPAVEFTTRAPTLDDVYLRFTGAPLADAA